MKKWILYLFLFCALSVGVFVLIFNVLSTTVLEIDKSSWQRIDKIGDYDIVYSRGVKGFSDFENSEYFVSNPATKLAEGLKNIDNNWNLDVLERSEDDRIGKTIYVYNTNIDVNENNNLNENDFTINLLAGGNISIAGKTNNAILAGVNFFLRECIIENSDGTKDIYVPTGSGYHFNYADGSNKIGGVDISNFYIVIDDVNDWGIKEKALSIQQKISEIANVFVPIVPQTNKIHKKDVGYYETGTVAGVENLTTQTNEQVMQTLVYSNEIYISGYSNLRSDAMEILENLSEDEYFVGVKNGKLLLLGQNAAAVSEACEYFINKLNNVQAGRFFRFSDNTLSSQGKVQYSNLLYIYVDATNGKDTNDGFTKETAVKSLGKAINIFNTKVKDFSNSFAKFEIVILDGSYDANNLKITVPQNITLNIKAYEKAKPIIESLEEITPLKDGSYYTYQFEGSGEGSKLTYPNIRQIYKQNSMLTMAQSKEGKTGAKAVLYSKDSNGALAQFLIEYNAQLDLTKETELVIDYPFTSYPIDFINRKVYIEGLDSTIQALMKTTMTGCEELWLTGQWQSFNLKIDGAGSDVLTIPTTVKDADGKNQTVYKEQTCYYVTVSQDKDEKGEVLKYKDQQFYKMYNSMLVRSDGEYKSRGYTNRECKILNSTTLLSSNNYVYDNTKGILYLKSSQVVQYPKSEILFNISNSSNITIDGLTFTGVEYKSIVSSGKTFNQAGRANGYIPSAAAIYGRNTSNITIKNCNFEEINCIGVHFKNKVNNLTLESNKFTNIGMSAIVVGETTTYRSYNAWITAGVRNAKIINNSLKNIGCLYPACCAILVPNADGLQILHNTINTTPYTAISIGWGWSWNAVKYNYLESFNLNRVEVAYNHITDFMQVLKDGGAIYALGANCKKEYTNYFNFMHDNYAYNKDFRENALIYVYYLDGTASNWEVYNNVGGGGTHGCYSQYIVNAEAHNNYIHDMYFIEGSFSGKIVEIEYTSLKGDEIISAAKRNVKVKEDSIKLINARDLNEDPVKSIINAAGSTLNNK